MDNTILTTTASASRDLVAAELSSSWGHEVPVTLTESGAIYLQMQETPVMCRFETTPLGHVVVDIESPILLDFVPPPSFYELISLQQFNLPFGSLLVAGGEGQDQVMLAANAKLFADGLTGTHLKRTILYVHRTAMEQLQLLQRLVPPIGGHGVYR